MHTNKRIEMIKVRFRRLYWQVILQREANFSVIVDQPGKEDKFCHQQRTKNFPLNGLMKKGRIKGGSLTY